MFDSSLMNDLSDTATLDEQSVYNLNLNEIDRFASALFTFGLYFSFASTDKTDQSIILKNTQNISTETTSGFDHDIAKTLATANWIYSLAGMLFLQTSNERLNQLEANLAENTSANVERISGREKVTLGNIFKVIGFLLAADGFEMIANSFMKEDEETLTPP